MKKQLFSLVIVMSFASQVSLANSLSSAIGDLTQLKEATNEWLSEVDAHYYLYFNYFPWSERKQLADGRCRSSKNYKKANLTKLIQEVNHVFLEAKRSLDGRTSDYGLDLILPLYDALKGKKITYCTEHTVPPYSDGQTLTFIQVDGKASFLYGFALPD